MGGNKILDEVGERGDVDRVEDQIWNKRDNVGEGENKMGESPVCGSALTV